MKSSTYVPGCSLLVLGLSNGCGGKNTSNANASSDDSSHAGSSSTHSSSDANATTGVGGDQGTSSAGRTTTNGPASEGATSNSGGTSSGAAATSAGNDGGAGGTSPGGADAGSSGAGGASCIDACEMYGSACCIDSEECIEPGNSCVLDILSASVDVIYDYESLVQKIAEVPDDVLVSIADTDILLASADPQPAARFEFELTSEASELYGALLDDTQIHPFWLSCNGQRLFAGVSYVSYGAAAIETPVLHVGRNEGGRWILALGASLGVWVGIHSREPMQAERIDRPELRAAFCQRGALAELDPGAQPPDL